MGLYSRLLQQGREYYNRGEAELNSQYKDEWGLIANEQSERVSGWKITEERHRGQRDFC